MFAAVVTIRPVFPGAAARPCCTGAVRGNRGRVHGCVYAVARGADRRLHPVAVQWSGDDRRRRRTCGPHAPPHQSNDRARHPMVAPHARAPPLPSHRAHRGNRPRPHPSAPAAQLEQDAWGDGACATVRGCGCGGRSSLTHSRAASSVPRGSGGRGRQPGRVAGWCACGRTGGGGVSGSGVLSMVCVSRTRTAQTAARSGGD